MGTLLNIFFTNFKKGNNYCDFLFDSLDDETPKKGYTLNRKNLLLKEQFLPLRVDP